MHATTDYPDTPPIGWEDPADQPPTPGPETDSLHYHVCRECDEAFDCYAVEGYGGCPEFDGHCSDCP